MATPYFQLRRQRVPSTQDVAREHLDTLPVLVVAAEQSAGRGRAGAGWQTADRALATSLAFRHDPHDDRPLSLLAGVAVTRAVSGTTLKWPNDVLVDGAKVGGILVERSGDVTVIGLGLNLWWPAPPDGTTALFAADPGAEAHLELGGLWGAETMEMLDGDGWGIDDYREACVTLGTEITWEPSGSGTAVDVSEDGALVVDTASGREHLHSGAIRHVRPA